MSKENREYRATHDEKNGVLRELLKLEGEMREESDREMQRRFEEKREQVKQDKRLPSLLAAYKAGKAMMEQAERDAAELGAVITSSYNEGPHIEPSSGGDSDIRNDVNRKLADRLRKLSEIRAAINLANLRSEVADLDKKARKL